MKSRKLKDRINHYRKYKKIKEVKELGTGGLGKSAKLVRPLFYLGVKIAFSEFREEQIVIKNNGVNNNGVTRIYKGRKTNNNIWIDNCKTMEYGESQPIGIQNTHKYATFDDYYHTAKHHLLKDRGSCPLCGCKEHYKTDIDVSCASCGLVLETNPKLMGWTHKDVNDADTLKTTVQDVAWNKFWRGE